MIRFCCQLLKATLLQLGNCFCSSASVLPHLIHFISMSVCPCSSLCSPFSLPILLFIYLLISSSSYYYLLGQSDWFCLSVSVSVCLPVWKCFNSLCLFFLSLQNTESYLCRLLQCLCDGLNVYLTLWTNHSVCFILLLSVCLSLPLSVRMERDGKKEVICQSKRHQG